MSKRSSGRNDRRPVVLPPLALTLLALVIGRTCFIPAESAPAAVTVPGGESDPLEGVKAAIRLKQFAAATGQLQRLAGAGNARAQYLLGVFYLNGLNGPRDVGQARAWLEKSSAQGDERAVIALRGLSGSVSQPAMARGRALEFADPTTRNEALWLAAAQGDLPAVKSLCDRTTVNSHDEFGRGALFRAALSGQTAVVEYLVHAGAEVNAVDHYGMTALMLAARSGQRQTVATLITAGARTGVADHAGNTALMHAVARGGDLQTVGLLLGAGSNLQARNVQGWSALDFAQAARDVTLVRKLADSGVTGRRDPLNVRVAEAILRARSPARDLYAGWTDLAVAASRPSPALLEQLPRYETGVNETAAEIAAPLLVATRANAGRTLDTLLSRQPAMAVRDKASEALLLAARSGEDEVLAALLAHKISPDIRSAEGEPAIVAAARAGHSSTLRLMISAHANAGLQDRAGKSALMIAAENSDSAMQEILLQAGAPVDSADLAGRTALWYAARAGDSNGVLLLLQHGADPDHADSSGVTPLDAACIGGSTAVVRVLLARGARHEARTTDGDTPLLLAAAHGHQAIIDLLLQAHADKDAQNRFGDTALILASRNGDVQMVKRMLAVGAATRIRNKDRETAADIAAARAFRSVAQLLETG